MRIKKSVGKDCKNHWIDVMEVQALLNDNMHLMQGPDFLAVDGFNGPITEEAIMVYQHQVLKFREPDGKIGPTGTTIKSLIKTAVPPPLTQPGMCINIATRDNLFPLMMTPAKSYKEGMRRFGSRRSKGRRLHAGCDLYAAPGTPIRAMQDGIVARPVENFYMGTKVLLIHHGDYLARYGEISRAATGIDNGATVSKGDVIGYVGELKFKSGNVMSMLHLELYEGTHSGPLSTRGNKYRRRGDLLDPTPVLDAAER